MKTYLLLIKEHVRETYWESGGIVPCVLNLGTRWRWVVSFTPRTLYHRGENPDNHWTGGRLGPRADLDAVAKRRTLNPCRELNSGRPARSQAYTDWAVWAPHLLFLNLLISLGPLSCWMQTDALALHLIRVFRTKCHVMRPYVVNST
jgi:hypothetical protein